MPHSNDAAGTSAKSLYTSAPKIYPRMARGRYARLRVLAMVVLLGLFYLLPWATIGGEPLVLFDLPARRFHVFGLTLVPQDLFLLAGLLVLAGFTLFLFTTLAGRLWCGYACPQTVWTEAFLWIERLVEGERHQRMKRDQGPWNADRITRKTAKHGLWLLFAAFTGISFVGFFVPIRELVGDLAALELSGWPLFWSAFYGFATWGNAGFMREQVCLYMCPYARFQSAMFDHDTLVIAYDAKRGEPRKRLAKRENQPAGDCIDCSLCVQVCPTGIDIRDGLQYQCIACAACVDACNEVMDRTGKPRGLIRYSSDRFDAEKRFHILRPRVIGYGIAWLLMATVLALALLNRAPLELDVIRDRAQLYRILPGERVENVYTLRLTNKTDQHHELRLSATTEDGRALTLSHDLLALDAGQTAPITLGVRAAAGSLPAHSTIVFHAESTTDPDVARSLPGRFFTAAAEEPQP